MTNIASEKITLIYDPNVGKVDQTGIPYQVINLNNEPKSELYLVLLEGGDAEFYRIAGKREGNLIVTSRFLDAVSADFFAKFQKDYETSPVYKKIRAERSSNMLSRKTSAISERVAKIEREDQSVNYTHLNDLSQSSGKGLFGGLFGKKAKIVDQIYFFGDSEKVANAQHRLTALLDKANAKKICYGEIVTVSRLLETASGKTSFILVADVNHLSSLPQGKDTLQVLASHGVSILDLDDVLYRMRESEILSVLQTICPVNIKSVLYERQRVILFTSNTGGVGKTTMSLNLSHWLASQNANSMYLEVIGGKGVDKVLGINSVSLETLFDGISKPKMFDLDRRSKVACISLEEASSGAISHPVSWQKFFDEYVLNQTATPYYHNVCVDTDSSMMSTRFLLNYATDVIMVTDMRPTTTSVAVLENMLSLSGGKVENTNYYVLFNQYRQDTRERYKYVRAELEIVAEERGVKLNTIMVNMLPEAFGLIHLQDDKARAKLVAPVVEALYGLKI